MYSSRFLRTRNLALFVMVFIFASVVYGFAAANTFPDGGGIAGVGDTPISGSVITNISYTMSAPGAGARNITNVSFDVDAVVTNAEVRLLDGGGLGDWHGCTSGDGISWSCNVSGGSYSAASRVNLEVATWQ